MAPALAEGIKRLSVKDIAIGGSRLSLTLSRATGETHLHIDDNPDRLRLRITRLPMGGH